MTVSFDPTISTDKDWVRFQIADTNEEAYFIEDETIQYFITLNSKEQAVIDCIKHIIGRLSRPDFKLDWMSISDQDAAREGYEKLLEDKKGELGITGGVTFSTEIYSPYRADSNQTDGDYTIVQDDSNYDAT